MSWRDSPIALSISAGVISVIVIIWLLWATWISSEFAQEATARTVVFERLAGEITYLDEVLTMSARMAASTGDLAWEDRYLAHAPILDTAVANAIEAAGNAIAAAGVAQTNQANLNLIEMEGRAFELVRNGRLDEALALLHSETYETEKALYAEGNKTFIGQLRDDLASSLASDRRHLDASLIAALMALIVVVGFWWLVSQHLRAQQRRLEVANRAKTEFLAAMSHELRTPLNAVVGFAEMIQMESFGPLGSPKYRDYIDDIHGAGQHLLALINDILDLSKVEAGMEELQEEYIEISDLMKSVHSLVCQRAQSGRLAFELDSPAGLPMLSGDIRKMKQILINLLVNAIKFTDPGGTVALKVRCEDGEGHVFQVIDTGIGIAPNDIPKALSLFGQVDSGLNRHYEGTGLGLPLTRALVHMHGGSFDVQSKLGVGTTVTIGFPAERVVRSLRGMEVVRAVGETAR
jgi:signal transduction histidine kinase